MMREKLLWSNLITENQMRECIHCGMCLPACPTYSITGRETDSPRGRIYLMRALADERIQMTDKAAEHLDMCLGCLACEPVCPSGVKYGQIIEAGRAMVYQQAKKPLFKKLVYDLFFRHVFPYPRRLRLALFPLKLWGSLPSFFKAPVLRLLPRTLRPFIELAPDIKNKQATVRQVPRLSKPPNTAPRRTGFLPGCVASVLFSETNQATLRVLEKNDYEVVIPQGVGCCGALPLHYGALETARKMAKHNIDVFLEENVATVVVNAAGCGAAMKEYGHLLKDDPEYREKASAFSILVKDVSEFLTMIPFKKPTKPLNQKITYHEACHLCHGQGVSKQPREILKSIPGLTFIELNDAQVCCGSAGTYNLTQPEMSEKLLREKVDRILESGAEVVASGNPGCSMQIQKGLNQRKSTVKVAHPVELLDEAYGYES